MDTVANILFVAIILGMIWITLSNKFGKDTPVNLGKIPVKGSVDQNYPYHDPSWDDKPAEADNAGNIYTPVVSSTNEETYKPSILDLIKQWAAQEDSK